MENPMTMQNPTPPAAPAAAPIAQPGAPKPKTEKPKASPAPPKPETKPAPKPEAKETKPAGRVMPKKVLKARAALEAWYKTQKERREKVAAKRKEFDGEIAQHKAKIVELRAMLSPAEDIRNAEEQRYKDAKAQSKSQRRATAVQHEAYKKARDKVRAIRADIKAACVAMKKINEKIRKG
jgi:hypothetical protein